MIGYVTIGALDSEASGKFYDAVLGALGDERKFADAAGSVGPKTQPRQLLLFRLPAYDKQPGVPARHHAAFVAHSKEE